MRWDFSIEDLRCIKMIVDLLHAMLRRDAYHALWIRPNALSFDHADVNIRGDFFRFFFWITHVHLCEGRQHVVSDKQVRRQIAVAWMTDQHHSANTYGDGGDEDNGKSNDEDDDTLTEKEEYNGDGSELLFNNQEISTTSNDFQG